MARVSQPEDAHRARRQQLLTGVSARLRELGIQAAFGVLEPYYDLYGTTPAGVTGLVVHEPVGTGRMQVTIVSPHWIMSPDEGGLSADGHTWVREMDIEYDLDDVVAFELSTLEGRGDGPGNPRAVWATRQLVEDEQAVVDAIRLWHGYRDSLRSRR
jgi:hypothetical protein